MGYIDDARIDLDRINKCLEKMGCDRRVTITRQRDGGRGSRRLMFDDYHNIGTRCTDKELAFALDIASTILQEVCRD